MSTPDTETGEPYRKHPLAHCENCPYQHKGGFVPTYNPHPISGIVVMGEAPGSYEAAKGIPFTGPSGDLLNQVLSHHGLHRETVMITNTVLCRPENNDDPPKSARDACAPRLHQEIKDSRAHTIVAVGKVAAHSALDEHGSMRRMRVGPPKPYVRDSTVRVVPTWHPAYSLRSPDSFPDLVFDFGKIKDGPTHDWHEPVFRVFDDPATAIRALDAIRTRYDRVVIDIECGVEKDNAFVHPSEYDLLCVGIAFAPGRAVVIGEIALADESVRVALRRLLSSTRIIAHNGKFDLAGLRSICGKQRLWFDTMLAAYCFAPGTRCLDSSLSWKNVEDLVIGDELIGFDEHYTSNMKPATVTGIKKQLANVFKIKTAKGEISASANHRWPVRRPDGEANKVVWKTTKELFDEKKRGWRLLHFVEPWEVDRTYEGGYLSGFLDGEGNYAGGSINRKSGSERIQFTQNSGPVLDKVLSLFKEKGFEPKFNSHVGRTAEQWEFSNRQAMRVLGSLRPTRFMEKSNKLWEGNRRCTPIDIYDVEYIGLQHVYGITTSTGTLVAEGFLSHNSLDERPGHMGLKVLSIERLGAPDYEQAIKQYVPRGGNYANIPREILYRYNAFDVVCTWALYELFSAEMTEDDRRKHDFIVKGANALIELELNGIGFDLDYNEKLAHEYLTKIADIEENIHQLIGFQLNPRSPQQVTNYYSRHGITLDSTNADLLKEMLPLISGESKEFTELLLTHRREAKLYGTYVKGLAKRVTDEGKVYTTYLLHGTTSGRLASREPNLQNVVRNKPIRNQFVVECEDNRLIQLDYKQAEGRVITTLARDEYLRAIFADDSRDLFSELCNDIFGEGKWGKENRVSMKSIFYGNAYGRGAASIARELQLQSPPVHISVEETAKLMRDFNDLIPEVKKWQAAIKHQVLSGNDLTTPYGRKRSFWLITDKNQADVLNEALSFLPQSIASDICLTALIRLQPMLEGLATVRLTIHDAIVVESHLSNVDATIDLMRTEMVRAAEEFTDYVPFSVDATIATRLGEL